MIPVPVVTLHHVFFLVFDKHHPRLNRYNTIIKETLQLTVYE